jgi:hypothetical protein
MKKDMISIIVGKIKKDKEKSGEESDLSQKYSEEEGEGEDHGLESAAESLIEAIQDEDTKGVIEALKSFLECCKEE